MHLKSFDRLSETPDLTLFVLSSPMEATMLLTNSTAEETKLASFHHIHPQLEFTLNNSERKEKKKKQGTHFKLAFYKREAGSVLKIFLLTFPSISRIRLWFS